jgi:exosortase
MSQVENRKIAGAKLSRTSRGQQPTTSVRARNVQSQPLAPTPQLSLEAQRQQLLFGAVVFAAGVWAYWPTLVKIVAAWSAEPEYSHGFLVVPLAIYFLWVRRERCPGIEAPDFVLGFTLLGLSVLARYVAVRFYFGFIDGNSILLWISSVVALSGGRRLLLWALPSIGFLLFMIPLPFSVERAMSAPLQRLATKLTCWTLQLLGQPAFNEGNVILLGSQTLEVAQACSGLRLFVSIAALAYAYVVLVRRTWWEKAMLLVAAAPIAIVANTARIVATGLLFQFMTSEAAHKLAHDFSGWMMIPLAAAMFGLLLWYMGKLIQEEEVLDSSALLRESRV